MESVRKIVSYSSKRAKNVWYRKSLNPCYYFLVALCRVEVRKILLILKLSENPYEEQSKGNRGQGLVQG